MPTVTLLERQQKNTDRVNVHLDGVFAFGLNELDAAQLYQGQELSEAEIVRLRDKDAVLQAYDRAIRFLSYRPRSSQEIRRHLTEKAIPPPVIAVALERLQTAGYVDDVAFARYWIEQRTRFQPRGPQALRYELRQKGIADDLIRELLEATDAAADAYRAAQPQVRRLRGHSRREFQHKIGALLQRRGFSYAIAAQVIHRLVQELAESDPAFFRRARR